MIYDISPIISERLAVWPGDTPFRRELLSDQGKGDSVTLSTMYATLHLGAHADAPSHYGKDGVSIDQCDLELYVGPCQVMRVPAERGQAIRAQDLPRPIVVPRLLIATGTFPDPERFNEDFAGLDPDLVGFVHDQGVRLVGIDTPGVDLFRAGDLPAHKMFLRYNMAILEGLALKTVPEGLYELIALPLKVAGCDASPVRAILRTV